MDPFDINWEALSVGELLALQAVIEGELKRRQFNGATARSEMRSDKQLAAIAADLRIASQRIRYFLREYKGARR